MSVRGEFERYVAVLIEALRDAEVAPWPGLADEIERNLRRHEGDLEARARLLLDGKLLVEPRDSPWPEAISDLIDSVLSIARIVLGRPSADVQ